MYIYCTNACASQSLFMFYYLCSYSLIIVHLFCSLFDCLFCFHSHRFFAYLLFKREKSNSDPEPCSGISILLPATRLYLFKFICHHHQYESINIIHQTPPTLSQYRSEGPITIIDITGQTKPISPSSNLKQRARQLPT